MSIIPPFLKPGSTIGITCPSSFVSQERIAFAIEILQRWGFNIVVGKTVGIKQTYLSGTDEERLADLQAMLDDDKIDAVLMGRGGYGMSRIIDSIDFTKFVQHPKWICGFSDIIVLQNHLQSVYNVASIHGPMCGAFKPETEQLDYIQSLKKALIGDELCYTIPPSAFNRVGTEEADLTGGNLSILAHLTGSVSELNADGKILFIEDVGEHLYNIDRLMLNLKRAGKLDKLKGLVVGSFNDLEDTEKPFGQTVEQIITDKVKEYDYPVAFNFECGHDTVNYTLCLGMKYKLTVETVMTTLELIR
jgi:muramoyltetrapeptide carboxypeptidase